MLLAEVIGVDTENHRVVLSDGSVDYDTLIVATGASHQYFGHDDWEKFAPGLKTVEDATHMRRRILLAFEAAEREPDPQKLRAWMTFVIVGGGPTGVELAGALGEIANDTLRNDFRNINPSEARIILVEGTDRILPPYPPESFAVSPKNGRASRRYRAHRRARHRCEGRVRHDSRGRQGRRDSHAHNSLGRGRSWFAARAESLPKPPARSSIKPGAWSFSRI